MKYNTLLVTGGAGFIGSAFIRYGLQHVPCRIINFDLLTYAAHPECVSFQDPKYRFVQGDVCDEALVEKLCIDERIDAIIHFAAESHVDRSIAGPKSFLQTNVCGTVSLLEVVRRHPHIHFHHVSTDEVYGSLQDGHFNELSPYQPNSPYAASKAASDHFVRAYAHTYALSTTLSHCTNNYGPFQNIEKLLPRMIHNCMYKLPLPVYGQGLNVRDWLYVDDHAEALWMILEKGKRGEVYDVGGGCEKRNIDLVHELIDQFAASQQADPQIWRQLITFVEDRPGHDFRYAIDAAKMRDELGWTPRHSFRAGLAKTLEHYHENRLCHSSSS